MSTKMFAINTSASRVRFTFHLTFVLLTLLSLPCFSSHHISLLLHYFHPLFSSPLYISFSYCSSIYLFPFCRPGWRGNLLIIIKYEVAPIVIVKEIIRFIVQKLILFGFHDHRLNDHWFSVESEPIASPDFLKILNTRQMPNVRKTQTTVQQPENQQPFKMPRVQNFLKLLPYLRLWQR